MFPLYPIFTSKFFWVLTVACTTVKNYFCVSPNSAGFAVTTNLILQQIQRYFFRHNIRNMQDNFMTPEEIAAKINFPISVEWSPTYVND